MNEHPCSEVVELLVDYADGELSAAERRRVVDHLSRCAECRAELRLLESSLELARAEWQEGAALLEEVPASSHNLHIPPHCNGGAFGRTRSRLRGRRVMAACVAASMLLVLLASTAWWLTRPKSGDQPQIAIARQEATSPQALSEEEIDAYISRQTRSARLAVAVRLLASQPGLEDYKTQAEQYLARVSGGTQRGP